MTAIDRAWNRIPDNGRISGKGHNSSAHMTLRKLGYTKIRGTMKSKKLYSTLSKLDYKKGMREDRGTHGPVSLTSIPGKIMEKIILGAIERYVKGKAIIRFLLEAPSLLHTWSLFFTSALCQTEYWRKTWFCLCYEMMLFQSNKLGLCICYNWSNDSAIFPGFSYWTDKGVRLKKKKRLFKIKNLRIFLANRHIRADNLPQYWNRIISWCASYTGFVQSWLLC